MTNQKSTKRNPRGKSVVVRYRDEDVKIIEQRCKDAGIFYTRFGKKLPNISEYIRFRSLT